MPWGNGVGSAEKKCVCVCWGVSVLGCPVPFVRLEQTGTARSEFKLLWSKCRAGFSASSCKDAIWQDSLEKHLYTVTHTDLSTSCPVGLSVSAEA